MFIVVKKYNIIIFIYVVYLHDNINNRMFCKELVFVFTTIIKGTRMKEQLIEKQKRGSTLTAWDWYYNGSEGVKLSDPDRPQTQGHYNVTWGPQAIMF